ncbi:dynein regulatory complex subunit 4-like [Stigmatopora argus]
MPPKKGKGKKEGKGKGKAKGPKPPPEPEPPPELSEEVKALIKQVEQLRKDVETEMKERNKFQLEVDMLRTFWEVTGQQLVETNAEYVNLFNEIEMDELNHRQYIKEYLGEIKLYREDVKKDQEDYKSHVQQVEELEVKPYEKERSEMILEEQLDIEDAVNMVKNKNNEDMARMGQQMKEQLLQTEQKYKKKLELLQHDLTNKEKTKLSEREYYWSSLIHNLQQDHDKRFREFDTFLEDCKKKDLLHKDKLKKQIQVFVTEENKNQRLDAKDVKMIKLEQKKVQAQIVKLRKLMRNPILKTHPNETVKGHELDELKCEYNVADQKFQQLERDINEMCKTYQERMQEIHQKADKEQAEIKSKLAVITEKLQKLQAVVCSRLFGFDFSSMGIHLKQSAPDSKEDPRQDHWSRKTRLNQTVIWQLQNVKELLQRDVETAVKERAALTKLINEKIDQVFQAKMAVQNVFCQMEMATKSNSGKGSRYSTPEPLEPPIYLQDDRSPMGGLMEEIVKIVCKNRRGKTQDRFSTLVFDQILDTQLRNSKELLQSHAEVASKKRTQLILLLNDKTHELHGLQRQVKETNQELEKQRLAADQNKSVEGALIRRSLM